VQKNLHYAAHSKYPVSRNVICAGFDIFSVLLLKMGPLGYAAHVHW